MIKKLKRFLSPSLTKLIAIFCKYTIHLLMFTCRIRLKGCEEFETLKKEHKCLLILWHNRLAIIPWLLNRYTPKTSYAALVSNSRDGDLLTKVIHSYQNYKTIRVSPKTRFQALNQVISHVLTTDDCITITPDGPKGPKYKLKPGIAIIALETNAYVASVNWTANRFWTLNTWDQLRIPKPFTTIYVDFNISPHLPSVMHSTIEETKSKLNQLLPVK